jgi:hypothetical protein
VVPNVLIVLLSLTTAFVVLGPALALVPKRASVHSPFQPLLDRSRCLLFQKFAGNIQENVTSVAYLNREASQHPVVAHGRSPPQEGQYFFLTIRGIKGHSNTVLVH